MSSSEEDESLEEALGRLKLSSRLVLSTKGGITKTKKKTRSRALSQHSVRSKKSKGESVIRRKNSSEVISLVRQLKAENSKSRLELKRLRKHLTELKADREKIYVAFKDLRVKFKSQKKDSSFWIMKSQKALLRIRDLKKRLSIPEKRRNQGKKVHAAPKVRKIPSIEKSIQTYCSGDDVLRQTRDMFKRREESLQKQLTLSFQNFDGLKRTHGRAVKEIRNVKQELLNVREERHQCNEIVSEMRKENVDLHRQLSVLRLKANMLKNRPIESEPESEDEATDVVNRFKHLGKENFLIHSEDTSNLSYDSDFQCELRPSVKKPKRMEKCKNSSEPANNLLMYDRYRKLRSMCQK